MCIRDRYPRSLAFAAVNFYPSRELDAREWIGPLPCGLAFSDSQADLLTKVGEEPASREDGDRTGVAVWQFARFTLSVVYKMCIRDSVTGVGVGHESKLIHTDAVLSLIHI